MGDAAVRVLVIPDVHLKPHMFDLADAIPNSEYDAIVCLGDIADDWNARVGDYEKTYKRALIFAEQHKDNIYWCYGNHDVSYMYASNGLVFLESGFNDDAALITSGFLKSLKMILGDRLAVIHKIDDTLFSHAGLSVPFVEDYLHYLVTDNIEDIVNRINSLIDASCIRLLWNDYSPLWVRPQHAFIDMLEPYLQVVGHTPVEVAEREGNILSLDTFSTYSDGSNIGDARLCIVDTKEMKVRGKK